MTDRLQAISAQEFEAFVKRKVQRLFEIVRQDLASEAPITGDQIHPGTTPKQYAMLEERAVMAVLAKRWFEKCEAPPWALALGGLPLSWGEIVALRNKGKPRPAALARYGEMLRAHGWQLKYAPPFETCWSG
jgi:hypothetical protein